MPRANVDVAIVLGKDQKEIWPDQSPSITIYTGAEVHNGPPQRPVYAPDHHVVHQAYPELATYLIETFQDEGLRSQRPASLARKRLDGERQGMQGRITRSSRTPTASSITRSWATIRRRMCRCC